MSASKHRRGLAAAAASLRKTLASMPTVRPSTSRRLGYATISDLIEHKRREAAGGSKHLSTPPTDALFEALSKALAGTPTVQVDEPLYPLDALLGAWAQVPNTQEDKARIIKRLRRSRKEGRTYAPALDTSGGLMAGAAWAADTAEYSTLERMAFHMKHLTADAERDGYPAWQFIAGTVLGIPEGDCTVCWEEVDDRFWHQIAGLSAEQLRSEDFVTGFVDGALRVFAEHRVDIERAEPLPLPLKDASVAVPQLKHYVGNPRPIPPEGKDKAP